MPMATKRVGNVMGRAFQIVTPSIRTISEKPAIKSRPDMGSSQTEFSSSPDMPAKPKSSPVSPVSNSKSAGSCAELPQRGFATRTGTNCNNAPLISNASQPIAMIWTRMRVSGARIP